MKLIPYMFHCINSHSIDVVLGKYPVNPVTETFSNKLIILIQIWQPKQPAVFHLQSWIYFCTFYFVVDQDIVSPRLNTNLIN